MKKRLLFLLLTAACLACAAAAASPAVTDGGTTGWIADNNYLFLQSGNGSVAQLPIEMADLLRMTDMTFERFLFLDREKSGGLFLKSFVFGTKGHQLPTLDFMGFFKGQGKYSLSTG